MFSYEMIFGTSSQDSGRQLTAGYLFNWEQFKVHCRAIYPGFQYLDDNEEDQKLFAATNLNSWLVDRAKERTERKGKTLEDPDRLKKWYPLDYDDELCYLICIQIRDANKPDWDETEAESRFIAVLEHFMGKIEAWPGGAKPRRVVVDLLKGRNTSS
jgi:hypothetical protein